MPRVTLNGALLASNALLFALSSAAVVASIAVFLLTRANDRQKDRELESFKTHSAERIAANEAQTATAKQTASEAGLKAAKANERAANLEKEASELKLRAAALELALADTRKTADKALSATSPRNLSRAQAAVISDVVRQAKPSISMTLVGDAEASRYGQQLAAALQDGGCHLELSQVGMVMPPQYGVILNEAAYTLLGAAFDLAGVGYARSADNGAPEIFVGSKPPF